MQSLDKLTDHNNIAELLDQDTLDSLGGKLCAAIKADDMSRDKWLKDNDRWLKMAQQVMEEKSYPWQGACYSLDTQILTKTGWMGIAAVKVGDEVYSRADDGVAGYYPVTNTYRFKSQEMVLFKGKSIDLLVTPNHKMVVEDAQGKKQQFIEASEFLTKPLQWKYIPLTSHNNFKTPEKIHGVGALAWARLLGWYVAEGFRAGKVSGSFVIAQSKKAHPEKFEILRKDIEACGISYKEYDTGFTLHARTMPAEMKKELRSLGVCDQKHIPRVYLNYDSSFLENLLDTLLLGDGHVTAKGHRCYYTTSKQLADDVQEICQKIGLRGTISKAQIKAGGVVRGRLIHGMLPSYVVSICQKTRITVFSLKRSTMSGLTDVACVETNPHHTVYVRRNGKAVWCGNSNVKYPTLSIAALQFHAQVMPTLFGNKDIVKGQVIGNDGDGALPEVTEEMPPEVIQQIEALRAAKQAKRKRANRVGRFMSIQAMNLMDGWVDDMDRNLFVLAIVGLFYKKTYWSEVRNKIVSDTISARDLILNYHAKNYERARMTHRIWMDDNELYEAKASKIFLDVDLGSNNDKEVPGTRDKAVGLSMVTAESADEETTPREIYETHTWVDLDEDGYKEPYIITIDADSTKVLRIVARWSQGGLIYNGTRILRVISDQYFTPYRFLPDPESAVYALGFGRLLGPTNAAVNSIMNMLIDQGHLKTLGGGFIGRGARVSGGVIRREPNKWISVQATGDDLKKHIVPFPDSEPSSVLFELLGLLINAGKDLSTVQDINLGRNPGQNQPYATTQEVISEGRKVFNGIYKRVYRAMTDEFKKIYSLNNSSLPKIEYLMIMDDPEANENDFSPDGLDIVPSAEPDMIAEFEKVAKSNALIGKWQAGMPLSAKEVTLRTLEAEGHENIEALMNVPPPPPSPEMMKIELENKQFEHQTVMDQANLILEEVKVRSQAKRDEANSLAVIINAQASQDQAETAALKARLDALNSEREREVKVAQEQVKVLMQRLEHMDKERDRQSKERVESKKADASARKSDTAKKD